MPRRFRVSPVGRYVRRRLLLVGVLAGLWSPVLHVQAQQIAKYGAEFLAGGVGGRALGMGGASVGIVQDVHAGYWNPAGLDGLQYPEVAYMHAERFAGIVSFDYAGFALPVNERSTIGVAIFRSGVDDIPNTLNAWDVERNQPKPDPENYIERFSAVDYAFFVSYARRLSPSLAFGATGKVIRRTIGDFADAWGYSFDAALRLRVRRWHLGATLQDLSTMLQSWSVNQGALAQLEAFEQSIPEGGTELVLPVLRLGSGYDLIFDASRLTLALDLDVAFDGQRRYVAHLGDVSFHPRVGAEYSYKEVVALRAGISRVLYGEAVGLSLTPTVGAGLRLNQFSIDYGFGDFAGFSSDLGYSHRISARLTLQQPRWGRGDRDG